MSSTIDESGNIDPDTLDALTICGDGSLDVTGMTAGIATAGNLIIKSGTVTATATSDNTIKCSALALALGNGKYLH